jgi:uncharacterized protein YdaU (DUF1376 family)
MPMYIGDYLGDTMHLTTEQHGAYLLLLFYLWRRPVLADDDAVLAKICGLSSGAWRRTRAVLAEFFLIADGTWRHNRIDKERARVQGVNDSYAAKAQKASLARWNSDAPSIPPSNAPSNAPSIPPSIASSIPQAMLEHADTQSHTHTHKDLRAKTSRVDVRHAVFRSVLAEYWLAKNPLSPEMPWTGRDAAQLNQLLKASPLLNEVQFRQLLQNRARSQVAHGDRVYLWIHNLTRYQEPMTQYNKPASAGSSYASRSDINRDATIDAVDRALGIVREQARAALGRTRPAGAEPTGLDYPGVPVVDGAGSAGGAVDLPGDGDYGLAPGDFADGPAGADGPLPYGKTVTVTS